MKTISSSKMVWWNVGAIVLEAISHLASDPVIPADWQPIFLTVVTVGNIVLRAFTNTGVTVLGSPVMMPKNGPAPK